MQVALLQLLGHLNLGASDDSLELLECSWTKLVLRLLVGLGKCVSAYFAPQGANGWVRKFGAKKKAKVCIRRRI